MNRVLHYVFKIGDRRAAYEFFVQLLDMKILRHEEFQEGCKAACNGPYDGKWSKTMVGYGPEDSNFVIELTYNYGIGSYSLGNDFGGIGVTSSELFARLKTSDSAENKLKLRDSEGREFFVLPEGNGAVISEVILHVSNLHRSLDYYTKYCGLNATKWNDSRAILQFEREQCSLILAQIEEKIDRKTAFGRIAFSCPTKKLAEIEGAVKAANETILTPLVTLETDGKACVQVVILADPDGHEICFVGDEAFRELSTVDPSAEEKFQKAVEDDKSAEWFLKKCGGKSTA